MCHIFRDQICNDNSAGNKRFEYTLSILTNVHAEGKREIIKCTDFVKNVEISKWNVYFVFKIQNDLTTDMLFSFFVIIDLIEGAKKNRVDLFSVFGAWPRGHVVNGRVLEAGGFGTEQ